MSREREKAVSNREGMKRNIKKPSPFEKAREVTVPLGSRATPPGHWVRVRVRVSGAWGVPLPGHYRAVHRSGLARWLPVHHGAVSGGAEGKGSALRSEEACMSSMAFASWKSMFHMVKGSWTHPRGGVKRRAALPHTPRRGQHAQ